MRPIQLDLEGFASYRSRTIIDFRDADFFVLVGPTGGYILGFVVGAAIIGAVATVAVRRAGRGTVWVLTAGGLLALLVVHAAGIVGLHLRAGLGWQAAATVDGAFWIGDLVKLAATVLVAGAVHRAFPDLLRRRA